jgi:hypothetical protein
MGPFAGVDYVDLNTFTIYLCQSRLYLPVRDLGFPLWLCFCSLELHYLCGTCTFTLYSYRWLLWLTVQYCHGEEENDRHDVFQTEIYISGEIRVGMKG